MDGLVALPDSTVEKLAAKAATFVKAYDAAQRPKPPAEKPKYKRVDPIERVVGGYVDTDEDKARWSKFDDFIHGLRVSMISASADNDAAKKELPILASQIAQRYKAAESIPTICRNTTYRGMNVSPEWVEQILKEKGFDV